MTSATILLAKGDSYSASPARLSFSDVMSDISLAWLVYGISTTFCFVRLVLPLWSSTIILSFSSSNLLLIDFLVASVTILLSCSTITSLLAFLTIRCNSSFVRCNTLPSYHRGTRSPCSCLDASDMMNSPSRKFESFDQLETKSKVLLSGFPQTAPKDPGQNLRDFIGRMNWFSKRFEVTTSPRLI
ncbi:UNVERIFIED_CONTAM: hypothetical protein Sindi_2884300 [Sesamum indicum]